jgi:transcriptional regulator with XRE-family HTH domain
MRIKKIRIELGLSQSEFAEKTGIKIKTLRFWEQGRRKPGVKNLMLISQALNLKLEELI